MSQVVPLLPGNLEEYMMGAPEGGSKGLVFWAWEDVGMAITNVRAINQLSLYPEPRTPKSNCESNRRRRAA